MQKQMQTFTKQIGNLILVCLNKTGELQVQIWIHTFTTKGKCAIQFKSKHDVYLELVSKELNHFGVIAGLFRKIGGHM